MADIYTTDVMGDTSWHTVSPIIGITSEATGYPKENLLDNNPDTYWKGTSDADQTMLFDLGSAQPIDGCYLFFKNYKSTDWTTGTIILSSSSTGLALSYTERATLVFDGVTTPNRLITISTTQEYRYWLIQLDNFVGETIPEVSIVSLLKNNELSQSHEFPIADSENHFNKTTIASGGRTFTRGINNSKTRTIPRSYKFSGTNDITALENAYYDSKGERYPVILQEGTTNAAVHLCKFTNKTFARNETDYQYYQPKVSFQTMPYIDDGDTY